MDTIRILIADDHNLIIDGIKSMLQNIKEFEIVDEAHDGKEAVNKALVLKPDVIIMDISMPLLNGIEASKEILKTLKEVKIIALSQHEDDEYVLKILEVGGYGYLSKNSKKAEFVEAINSVVNNKKYFNKRIYDLMVSRMLNQKEIIKEREEKVHITSREKEIIQLIANEMSNQKISEALNISLRTVETHRRNVMQKLHVKSAISLIKAASQLNIIDLK